jgi:hypothetical protein
VNILSLDQVTDLRTDKVPDSVQWGVKYSVCRLDGDVHKSASRLGEWCSEQIRAINQFRVVAIPGDAIIVRSPLVLIRGILGANAANTGEGREIRRHRSQVA